MFNALVAGKLANDPQTRKAANGNPYATGLIAVDTPEGSVLCGIIAFGAAGERLALLKRGDGIAATGEAKLSSWDKGGEKKHGISITAVEVLSPFVARQRRKAMADARDRDRPDVTPSEFDRDYAAA